MPEGSGPLIELPLQGPQRGSIPVRVLNESRAILFESLVLCDDVRYENNGKLLLVGV